MLLHHYPLSASDLSFLLVASQLEFKFNTQEELHTQKRMQFDKVLITMGITLESSKIKISIVIALAIFHLLCTY